MKKISTIIVVFAMHFAVHAQGSSDPIQDSIIVSDSILPNTQETVEDLPWHARRFRLMAGGFFPLNNTAVSVNGNNGRIGTRIDLEDNLGFDTTTNSFYANAMWRASKRSKFELEYFYLDRKTVYTLDESINFKDHTYPIYAQVGAYFNTSILRFDYQYAIICKPKYEIGVLIGTHLMFIDMGMWLDTNIGSVGISDQFKVTAPLPDVGIWGSWVLGKRFGLYGNINYLSAKIDNIDGSILSYNVSLLFNAYRNFSIMAGYSGLDVDVHVQRRFLNGSLEWGYKGPTIAATYTFGNHIKF